MSKLPKKVLIIDQDQTETNRITSILSKHSIPVITATNWEQAIYHYNQNKIDMVICQNNLDAQPAPLVIQKFRGHEVPSKRNPGFIITHSKALEAGETQLLAELGEIVTVPKPIKEATLISLVTKAMIAAEGRWKLHRVQVDLIDPLLAKKKFDKACEFAETKLMDVGSKGQFAASHVFEEAENFKKAINVTSKLHQEDPKNLNYVNHLARLKMKTGDLQDASKLYEKADRLAPDNLARLEEMATLYLELNAPDKSIEKYKQLITHNPEEPDLKYDFFERLQNAGFEKEAQRFCAETTGAMELIRHFNNKGVMYSKAKSLSMPLTNTRKPEDLSPILRTSIAFYITWPLLILT